MSFGSIVNVPAAKGRSGRRGTKREAVFRALAFAEAVGVQLSNQGLLYVSAEKWAEMRGDDAIYDNYANAVGSEMSRVLAGKSDPPQDYRAWVIAEYQRHRDLAESIAHAENDAERIAIVQEELDGFDYHLNPHDNNKIQRITRRKLSEREAGAVVANYINLWRHAEEVSVEEFAEQYVEPWKKK